MTDQLTPDIDDTSPSAKLVYKILEYEGPLTQKEIREETGLGQRTAYNALQELEDANAIESSLAEDLRQRLYSLK